MHRRTFQNTNQLVELTIRTIPKTLPPPPPPPPQAHNRNCYARNHYNKAAAGPSNDVQHDPSGRLAGWSPRKSKVTVEVRQKGTRCSKRTGGGGREERDASTSRQGLLLHSSDSGSRRRRERSNIIEENVTESPHLPPPLPPLLPPCLNSSQSSLNSVSPSPPPANATHPESHPNLSSVPHASQQSSRVPPSSLPPVTTAASHSHTHSHSQSLGVS